MTDTPPLVVSGYLRQLDAAMADLPAEVRADIVGGVREELAGLDAARAAERIEVLGDPAFIAAEARGALADEPVAAASVLPTTSPQWYPVVAALVLMIGSIVVPIVGTVVGLVLMWTSRTWTRADKFIATLAPPVLALVFGLALNAVTVMTASPIPSSGPGENAIINPLIPSLPTVFHGAFIALFVLWVIDGAWLLIRLRRRPRA
jgi:hypothetical protein